MLLTESYIFVSADHQYYPPLGRLTKMMMLVGQIISEKLVGHLSILIMFIISIYVSFIVEFDLRSSRNQWYLISEVWVLHHLSRFEQSNYQWSTTSYRPSAGFHDLILSNGLLANTLTPYQLIGSIGRPPV